MPDASLVTIDTGHHVDHDEPTEFIATVDAPLAVRVVRCPAPPSNMGE
ncbi:hypothetical protein [Micromonospora qiuiae]|nr:hypothetical protein [Micromonospora qiuiae]